MASIDQAMADTLAMVNTARKAFGVEALSELPSASPGQASDCIFARALRPIGVVSVDGRGKMRFSDERKAATAASYWGVEVDPLSGQVAAPPEFQEVITAFDNRRLPEANSNLQND